MTNLRRLFLLSLSLALGFIPLFAFSDVSREGQERIGTAAPEWKLQHWVNSGPLEIGDLKGKVVLVRWWTDTCELCAATAPALRKLQEKYAAQGLQVVGIFHPKPAGDWSVQRVQRSAARNAFTFPVALDGDWTALKRWWLDGARRSYTSVSFLVDKHGVIRYVHPGGEFHESDGSRGHDLCQADFKAIDKTIGELLSEK
jgi:peroxiredoxin